MNRISHKLRSRSGASMIIALVFLLFCMFIGGAVLASASANGARAAKQTQQQQAYLDQRSAALLLADQLRLEPDFQLIIKDKTTVEELGTGTMESWTALTGDEARRDEHRLVTFEVHASLTPLQRVLVESTILRYLEENDWPEFKFTDHTGTKTALSQLSCYHAGAGSPTVGSIHFTGTSDSWTFADFSANLSCDNNYNFFVDFGQYSQLSITVAANAGESSYDIPERYREMPGSSRLWQIRDHMEYTVVTWGLPQIEKEGAV